MQRRGAKESLEGMAGESIAEGSCGVATQVAGEDELAVEGIIENAPQTASTSDFVSDNGLPVGIDTAVVRSIERYGIRLISRE